MKSQKVTDYTLLVKYIVQIKQNIEIRIKII